MLDDIDSIRAQRLDALREIHAFEAVRANRAEAKAALADWVNRTAAYGAETLRSAVARIARDGSVSADAMGFTAHPNRLERDGLDLAPLLVALIGPKRVTDALAAHVDCIDEGPGAEARRERVDALRARLARLETIEEFQIVQAERAGAHVLRRPDADPAVVLMPEAALAAAYAAALATERAA